MTLAFSDLMFLHQPSAVWAEYDSVGDGSQDFGTHLGDLGGTVCYGQPSGHPMTDGTLPLSR